MNLAEWAKTQPQDNFVYVMMCGHEHDSAFQRSPHVYVHCSVHGRQELVEGPFITHRWSPR